MIKYQIEVEEGNLSDDDFILFMKQVFSMYMVSDSDGQWLIVDLIENALCNRSEELIFRGVLLSIEEKSYIPLDRYPSTDKIR